MDPELIISIFQLSFASLGTIYLGTAFGFPGWFKQNLSVNDLERRGAGKIRFWGQAAILAIGVGVLAYAASYALISAIPFGWGYHDEYDDWHATRDSIRSLLTLLGAIFLMVSAERSADALIWSKLERTARRSIQRAILSSAHQDQKLIADVLRELRKDLGIDEFYAKQGWVTEQQRKFLDDLCSQLKRGDSRWI